MRVNQDIIAVNADNYLMVIDVKKRILLNKCALQNYSCIYPLKEYHYEWNPFAIIKDSDCLASILWKRSIQKGRHYLLKRKLEPYFTIHQLDTMLLQHNCGINH
ncbi:UNKNOWN [Stylonychia lemnae]|uniref:Uncharacterized protein n=1 Tax=Stylonychia lemnae TaxID=5949 RepID=A0A078B7L0_STYLE|nr:UNKNOWN [Stylonychia lemnae]|eukprot:CDW90211.1 UNKNOWN [Stylonychia lemnae]